MATETGIPELRAELGAPNNQYLFPRHFLEVVLPKLGGKITTDADSTSFTFPHPDSPRIRFHGRDGRYELRIGDSITDPENLTYTSTHSEITGLDIGHPDQKEVAAIRALQKLVWSTDDDSLYPADIHSDQFDLPTTLVARESGVVIGFVFGFWYANPRFLESQIMGVHPDYQGKRQVGFNLKVEQFRQAVSREIQQVSWTVDPLEAANAVLNWNKLRAKGDVFYPDLYPFSNARNRVRASRLKATWKADDPQVGQVLETRTPRLATRPELSEFKDTAIVTASTVPNSAKIAIPIPQDWQAMQRDDLEAAKDTRSRTDDIFKAVIGSFVITTVAFDGSQPYLIGERV